MVKKTFGSTKWVFPGGAIKDGESKEDSCKREVAEDLGVKLSKVTYTGSFTQKVHHRKETIHCFSANTSKSKMSLAKDKVELARWLNLSELPDLTPVSSSVVDLFRRKHS